MPTSMPVLDALKAKKSAQRDKEAIQRNHPHYKDLQLKHPRRTIPKRRPPPPPVLIPRRKRQRVDRIAWQTSCGEGCSAPRRRPLRLAPRRSRRPETHPLLHPPVAKSSPSPLRARSEQGQVWVRQQASTQTAVHITRSSHIDGPFTFESPNRPWYIHYARTCAFPCACEL